MKPHKVALVLDREFGDRLVDLSKEVHVWVCDTPSNRRAAERVWAENNRHSLESGITTFTVSTGETPEKMLLGQVGPIDLHHGMYSHSPAWSILEVHGCSVSPAIKEALQNFGSEFKDTQDGFIFYR